MFLYIDPGTGMILIQLIVAGVTSVLVFLRISVKKLKICLKENETRDRLGTLLDSYLKKKQIFRVVNKSYQTNFNHLFLRLYSELVEKILSPARKTEKNISKDQYCVLKLIGYFL